ncbi:MAG: DMT family transporter [Anaerovibrio sp.]|uniref:DMT family transporter n=1 Tax=Anaerovibrio sp. TaxID=1872532 RepID=UPI0025E3DAFC|nr:DMT family transporter [Anaerovibrio sp.]MCR5176400.1 DMT family transporter [Anaerovibrio sp.]
MKNNTLKSYSMLIAAMLIWGSVGIFRRNIPVSSEFLALTRGILGTLCMLLLIYYNRHKNIEWPSPINIMILAFTGMLLGFNWIFLFEAFNFTTVPIATLCYYMEPTIVILISPLFFKDSITVKHILIVFLTITGMIMISGLPDHSQIGYDSLKGVGFGLAAALLYAFTIILNKKIEQVDTYQKTFIQLAGAALIMLPYTFFTQAFPATVPDETTLLLLLTVGLVHTGLAYALYFGSMRQLSARTVAICSYIDPISALFLSAIILDEALSPLGIVGAFLIIGTLLASEIISLKKIVH